MSKAAILDTSWLLELYRVPRDSDADRTDQVREETTEIVGDDGELFVTVPVPVPFEVASHITRVKDGRQRRRLSKKLFEDVKSSMGQDEPWTIIGVGKDVLLRTEDLLHLAERFLQESGPNHSFANISIIDLATELRKRNPDTTILTFNAALKSHSP